MVKSKHEAIFSQSMNETCLDLHHPRLLREHNDQSLEHAVDLEWFLWSDGVHRRLLDLELRDCSFSNKISLHRRRFYTEKQTNDDVEIRTRERFTEVFSYHRIPLN